MRAQLLRQFFILALFAGISTMALAQPAPDCANCDCPTFPQSGMLGVNMWTATTQPVCDPSNPTVYTHDANRFARFYAVTGRRYTFSLCSNVNSTQIFITTNTTIAGLIVCDNNGCGTPNGPSQVSFVPAVNAIYRLYIFNGSCPNIYPVGSNVEVVMTCTPIAPPPNDLPCGAINLPISGLDCNFTNGDNTAATNAAGAGGIGNIPVPNCTGALFQGFDLWYTVTVPPSGLIGIQSVEATICAGAFQMYTTTNCATGTAFTPLAGSCTTNGITGPNTIPATVFDAFANVPPLAVGSTVYIRYWERNGNENGLFGLCAYEAQRPPNDEPCAPIALPLNTTCQPTQYTFENASPSTVPNPTCGNTATVNDVWFTFTVPNVLPGNWSGISVNTLAGTPVDLSMAWYRLTTPPCAPGSLTQIACNASANINSAAINPNLLNAGETIYVRIWGEQPWVGTYDICAVLNQAPANDEPCGALPLTVNYGCLMQTYSNSSATNSLSPGAPSCGAPATNDVWFTVVVPPNGAIQIDMLAGSMTDAAMAIYTGPCSNLTQLAPFANTCRINGSQQGAGNALMPYIALTGLTPGATLYVRVWRQGGGDGTFGICARRTDNPPGACFYTLTMTDSGGDGWGGSFVTICMGGVCTNYTVMGSTASVSFGANVGQLFTVSYTAAGGQQNQNAYQITQYSQPVYTSGNSPATGVVYSTTVVCDPPPAPAGDCMGAISICTSATVPCQPYQPGVVTDLNGSNSGCMSGQQQGVFMLLMFGPNTPPCSPAAFDVVGGNSAGCGTWSNNIFDFVMWGPYNTAANNGMMNAGNICPITQMPYRCNWASLSSPTVKGLAFNNALPVSQNGGGGPMARHMVVNPGDRFLLFVNNWSGTGQQFQIQWKTAPAGFQVLASDCNQSSPWVDGPAVPAPPGTSTTPDCWPLPVEFASFDAIPAEKHVDVEWSTAVESGSSHFNVQRSSDGENFSVIGRVDAAMFSYELTRYAFVDGAPLQGLSYYRLEQVDQDGRTSKTHMVPVMFKGGRLVMEVYPNPTNETIWLSFNIDKEAQLLWRISDASGRLVMENMVNSTTGRNVFELPISRIDQGTYLIELVHKDGEQIGVSRFVKQ